MRMVQTVRQKSLFGDDKITANFRLGRDYFCILGGVRPAMLENRKKNRYFDRKVAIVFDQGVISSQHWIQQGVYTIAVLFDAILVNGEKSLFSFIIVTINYNDNVNSKMY